MKKVLTKRNVRYMSPVRKLLLVWYIFAKLPDSAEGCALQCVISRSGMASQLTGTQCMQGLCKHGLTVMLYRIVVNILVHGQKHGNHTLC